MGFFNDTDRFLAYVDLLGTTYSASTIATGYGAYIAQPLLRRAVEDNEDVLTEAAAQKILEDCMRVLFYRDARALNKVRPSCDVLHKVYSRFAVPNRYYHR
jgi:20S proteasome subunit beta 7